MEQKEQQSTGSQPSQAAAEPDQRSDRAKSRWSPKPEQIMILESIFNSGIVNPPRDETGRIRKILQKFGPVGDANVFYWFQNRRSRSRRRLRQIQATRAEQAPAQQPPGGGVNGASVIQFEDFLGNFGLNNNNSNNDGGGKSVVVANYGVNTGSSSSCMVGSCSNSVPVDGNYNMNCDVGSCNNSDEFFYYFLDQPSTGQEYEQNPIFCSAAAADDASALHYQQPEVITVFINGVATDVGIGPLHIRAICNEEFLLYHSSGVAVEMDEYGFLVHSLQHGESYVLVPRQ